MSMKPIIAAALMCAAITPAYAAVSVSSTPGPGPGEGAATFNFNAAFPEYNGTIYTDTIGGIREQPFGSTGGYGAVGPDNDASPRILNLSAFGSIETISFLWGSIDTYNRLDVLGAGLDPDAPIFTVNGGNPDVSPASGNTTDPNENRWVTLTFTGSSRDEVTGLAFYSPGQNAFEYDNVRVTTSAIPEPLSWAMMVVGFGALGATLRHRRPASQMLA